MRWLVRWFGRLVCRWTRKHVYLPIEEVRQIRLKRKTRYHWRFEFRYKCVRCQQYTRWMPLSRRDAWEDQNDPQWR